MEKFAPVGSVVHKYYMYNLHVLNLKVILVIINSRWLAKRNF
jgi:hypothetical protein